MSLREALLTLSNEELDSAFKEALQLLEKRKTRDQGDFHPEFLDINEAFNETAILNWIIPGLVLGGTVNFLVGAGGRGKSLLTVYLGAELATGLVGGYFTENCPSLKTLIINLEDPQEILKKRLQTFIKPTFSSLINVLNKNLKIWPAIGQLGPLFEKTLSGLNVTENFEKIQTVIERERPRFVILDPLMRFLGVEENNNDLVGAIFVKFEKIAKDLGLSWLLVHHTSKILRNSEQDIALRGASAYADASRSVWVATKPSPAEEALIPGVGPVLKLNFSKISYGPSRTPVLFRFEPDKGVSWKRLENTDLVGELLKLFSGHEICLSIRDISRVLKLPKKDIEPVLTDLSAAGILERVVSPSGNKGGRPSIKYRLKNREVLSPDENH